jgi:hypothetical protein
MSEKKAFIHGWSGQHAIVDGVPSEADAPPKPVNPLDWLKGKLGLGKIPRATDGGIGYNGNIPNATDNQEHRGVK